MAGLSELERRFIDENPFYAVVTTVRNDLTLHSTVVWVGMLDDGTLAFNTARQRAKERHLGRNPELALLVMDPGNPRRWVSVSGRGEVTEDGALAQIAGLSKKYTGREEYPRARPGQEEETRVTVRVSISRVLSMGMDS